LCWCFIVRYDCRKFNTVKKNLNKEHIYTIKKLINKAAFARFKPAVRLL